MEKATTPNVVKLFAKVALRNIEYSTILFRCQNWSHRLILIQKMSLGWPSWAAAARQSQQMLDLF